MRPVYLQSVPTAMVSLGFPKGVSTSMNSTSVSPSISYSPLPPMIAIFVALSGTS